MSDKRRCKKHFPGFSKRQLKEGVYSIMTFYTKPILKVYRYMFLFVFIGLPLYLATLAFFDISMVKQEDVLPHLLTMLLLAIVGAVLTHFFWEKFFAVLTVADGQIIWRCPFRKTLRLQIDQCDYIGVQREDAHNGLLYYFIYVSDRPYPQEYAGKINKVSCKEGFIKFWYSEELSAYLISQIPGNKAGQLLAFRIQQKKKNKREKDI